MYRQSKQMFVYKNSTCISTCLIYLILLALISLPIFGDEYKFEKQQYIVFSYYLFFISLVWKSGNLNTPSLPFICHISHPYEQKIHV